VVHGTPALDVPATVRLLAGRCLAKDPGQRPTTAELLAELDGADLAAGCLPAPVAGDLSGQARLPGPLGSGGWLPAEPGHASAAAADAPGSGVPILTAARGTTPAAMRPHLLPRLRARRPGAGQPS
jgi:hypothetical protein